MPPVRRRCVFYLGGFDPRGAGHYHALYRNEAAAQAAAGGLTLEVGRRRREPGGNAAWTVHAQEGDTSVQTHYEFMRWDQVVRRHWARGRLALWGDVLVASAFNLRQGALWRMFKLCWPAGVALTLPLLVVCVIGLGMPTAAALLAWAAYRGGVHAWLAVPGILLLLFAADVFERRMDARFNMYWLMRSYAFTRKQALGRTPDLEVTLDAHAQRLAQRLAEGIDDEVLVVGHSTGAVMAAAVVARALRLRPAATRPALSLLTLGQCMPLLASLPPASDFRRELVELGGASTLHWTDFSAPPDACCFPLCNVLAEPDVLGAAAPEGRPKLLSPRFAEMFDPAAYRALRRDKFRMHFQYLMAAPRAVDYDYFRITAGASTLAERYAHLPGVADFHALRPFGAPRRG